VVLTDNGEVFTFGCNDEGALGRKGTECLPEKVALNDPIDMISAGDNHSLFANSVNGAIYFAGNYNYQRGEKMR
jgi:regulator of chromosome condensation